MVGNHGTTAPCQLQLIVMEYVISVGWLLLVYFNNPNHQLEEQTARLVAQP